MWFYLYWVLVYVALVVVVDFVGDLGVQPSWRVPFYVKGKRNQKHPDAEHYWSPLEVAFVLTCAIAATIGVYGGR